METDLNETLANKKIAKENISNKFKIKNNEPLVGIYLNKNLKKSEIELFKNIEEALRELSINLLLLNDSDLKFSNVNKNFFNLEYNLKNRSQFLEAIDVIIYLDFIDLDEIFINGVVPISLENDRLIDYDAKSETGNAFTYEKNNVWHFLKALIRSLETYQFTYDWKHIVRNALNSFTGE